MCEQCLAKTESYGEVLPGWFLVRATQDGKVMNSGDWGLVQINDPSFIWSDTPEREPPLNEDWSVFDSKVRKFRDSIMDCGYPTLVYALVKACVKKGYNPGKDQVEFWLFEYLEPWTKLTPKQEHE